jgi:serine/threonine protein kinase
MAQGDLRQEGLDSGGDATIAGLPSAPGAQTAAELTAAAKHRGVTVADRGSSRMEDDRTDGENPTISVDTAAARRQDSEIRPSADMTLDDLNNPSRASITRTGQTKPAGDDFDARIRADLERTSSPRERKDPLLGTMVGGRFLVVKKIGVGGMGAVYRAKQEGMDRDVAVKVLLGDMTENDTVLRRFTLEALAVSRLRHPNTIQIFDYGQTPQGHPYIAMELLEGQTLHDLLKKERPVPIRRALRILAQVAQSLAEAHSKEIVHRDLKPENIFLVTVGDNPDFVKVLDFGVAKLRDHNSDQGTLTQAGSIFGTPRYMSPEQCSAQTVDHRSDIYALGVILYEMIVGQAPFASDQALALLLAHVNEVPVRPGTAAFEKHIVPAEVDDLVMQLLEKAPADRVQSAGELAKLCDDLAHSLPAAFEARVGSEEADALGVRLSSNTTAEYMTARTIKMGIEVASPAPVLEQPPPPPPAHMGTLAKVAIGSVVLALSGGVIWLATRDPDVVVQTQVVEKERLVTVQAPIPPNEAIRIKVQTVPPGAKIHRGNVLVGMGNTVLERKKGSDDEEWTFSHDGYKPQTQQVSFRESRELQIKLEPLPAVVAKPKPVASPAGPSGPKPAVVPAKVETKPADKVEPKPEVKPVPVKKPPVDDKLDDLQ